MFPALRRVVATAIVGLALQGAAHGGPPPDSRAAWLKLDPLFRIQNSIGSTAEPVQSFSALTSLRTDSMIAGFAEFIGSREQLEALGARVGTQIGDLFTVRLKAADLERLLGDPRLQRFQVGRPMSLHLHASGQVIGSPVIHQPIPGFPDGIQGQGVLVGIADSGIDLDVADFKDASGVTRLVGLWDQGFHFHPPPGYDYGTSYDAAELRAGGIPEIDRIGHGTHVAGIAAGNGRATGHGIPALYHVGVAPRADIAVVKLDPFFIDVILVDALRYLFDLARSRGQDAVVNMSLGSQWGPRDGTSMLERMLSALTGPGRILVVSAGNDGAGGIHTQIRYAAGAPGAAHFRIVPRTPSPGLNNDHQTIEGWGAPGQRVLITLTTPGGTTYGPVAPGEKLGFTGPEGDVTIYNDSGTWPLRDPFSPQGNSSSWFVLRLSDQIDETHAPASGVWTLGLASAGGDGLFDVWMDGLPFTSISPRPDFGAEADPSRTLDVPGTCDSCITVASFVTMDAWRDSAGHETGYAARGMPAAEVGALSIFSSRGPRRDGAARPDLAAPGQGVASGLSRGTYWEEWRVYEDATHVVLEGTSMSAPQVAGAAALLLQIVPRLPPARVRDILRRAAAEDAFTGPVPNSDWGAGKLDLRRLVEVANQTLVAGVRGLSLSHDRNPAASPVRFRILASAARDAAKLEVFSVDGRQVFARDIGPLRLGVTDVEWDPVMRGSALPTGVYFARVRSGGSEASDKITLLR